MRLLGQNFPQKRLYFVKWITAHGKPGVAVAPLATVFGVVRAAFFNNWTIV
ncbi:MAG: hypothetical protein M9908_03860 [Phyllobacteriaceae bacterium]|nr:hypothetical protein [Phyllobacteriaceae bacterium]